MTFSEICKAILEHKDISIGVLIVLMSLIEISPIKFNPWQSLIMFIRKINGVNDIYSKINEMYSQIQKLEERVDEGQAIQSRVRILRFGDELQRDIRHSKDAFNQVIDDITRYKKYCETHPYFKNDMTVLTSKIIEDKFTECLRDNNFL